MWMGADIEQRQRPPCGGCLRSSVYRGLTRLFRWSRAGALVVSGYAAVWSAACAQSLGEPHLVPVPAASLQATPGTGDIRDYEAALAAVADVFERDVGLPRPDVTLVLFPNRRSFEAGLMVVGYEPQFARQSAISFKAIAGPTAILVNDGLLRSARWPDRVQLLAHELVHCVQYRFANGVRGTSEQWLREGFAEIVSMQVTERLGFGRYSRMRETLLLPLADVRPGMLPVPLAQLSTFPEWAAAQTKFDVPVYAQAFVAAELLHERHGAEAIIDYFRLFGTSMDKDANFREAFGMTLEEFDMEFAGRWQLVLMQTR
jgi:hypothetical protein